MLLPAATSAPFTTVAAVDANKDTAAFASVLTGSLVGLWDRLINIKDVLVFFLGISAIHVILVSRANQDSKSVYDSCASSSVLMLFWVATLVVFTAAISIARSHRPLSILYEVLVTILNVTVAMVIAAASGPHRWALQQGVNRFLEPCKPLQALYTVTRMYACQPVDMLATVASPLRAPHWYTLADITGSGSVVTSALILWAKPPGGKYGLLWVVLFAVAAILIQLTLVDLVVLEELSKSWKYVEANGTTLDDTLGDVTDRLDSLENLFNTTTA